MRKRSGGFTLIEMLVVIAIIAMLVAVIMPTVTAASTKARAATDGANLRVILEEANTLIMTGNDLEETLEHEERRRLTSKSFPDAVLTVAYSYPGFVDVFYVANESDYYGLDYFVDVATNGSSELSTAQPYAGDSSIEWKPIRPND